MLSSAREDRKGLLDTGANEDVECDASRAGNDQADGSDGRGPRATRLLNEEVARCDTAGSGVPGQDVGRPGDNEAPAAKSENDLMTICSGFVRCEMGGTAAGGAAGGGQASRRPVMLHRTFDAEWQRRRECIACSCFLHVFWHFCGTLNHPNCKSIGYFESPIE